MTLSEKLAAARGAAATGPVESRGILRLSGKGGRDFLHRVSTQHLSALPADGSAYAAFLDGRGHIVGEGLVVARPDDLLFVTEVEEVAILLPHLRKYLLNAPVKIDDASPALGAMAVLGPKGIGLARQAVAGARDGSGGELTAAATPRRGVPAVEVIGPPDRLSAVRATLLAAGVADLEAADLEALRIEEGVARFGIDMDAQRLPMEAALTRDAIHFQKGCYLGQEVVLRATVRGQIQKGLVQLELPPGVGPGTVLTAGDKEAGWVTSAAETTQGRLGLGYLRRAFWREGERLTTPAGEAIVRRVVVREPE
jgi:folate-binding protein YgfZ